MLTKIKDFFEQNINTPDDKVHEERRIQLATAALLIEMMLQDDKIHHNEIKVIKDSLSTTFGLPEGETQQLFELAEYELTQATDYYQFTSLIQKHYNQHEKIHIIELLWRVAYADSELDVYEEHMIRKISDLIYVPHSDFLKAKFKVQNSLNQS